MVFEPWKISHVHTTILREAEVDPMAVSQRVRLASWNIHEFRDTKDKAFDPWSEIRNYDPDILCLQEYTVPCIKSTRKLRRRIRQESGYAFVAILVLSRTSYQSKARPNQAVVVLSKFPMDADVRYHRLAGPEYLPSGTPLELHDKGAVSVSLRSPAGRIRLICLHAFPFHRFGIGDDLGMEDCKARKAFHAIDQFIADEAELLANGERLVVAGDFNFQERWKVLHEPARLGLRSAFGHNLSTRDDGRSHDDILVDSTIKTCGAQVLETKSDHHLLTVELGRDWTSRQERGAASGSGDLERSVSIRELSAL